MMRVTSIEIRPSSIEIRITLARTRVTLARTRAMLIKLFESGVIPHTYYPSTPINYKRLHLIEIFGSPPLLNFELEDICMLSFY